MENEFSEDIYWDLKELNPDAIIYTEYHDSYMGFTLKQGKYVAVYDAIGVEESLAQELMQNENFLDDSFQTMDGKIEKKNVVEGLSRLAKIKSMEISSSLLRDWDKKENAPVMFFLPKVIKASYEEENDEVFKYGE